MLEVRDLSAAYGQHPALNDIALSVQPGEIVVILGANGAGKSTLLRAIAGICEGKVSGEVLLNGQSLTHKLPDQIVEQGIALVPEGRGVFGDLTVRENLALGAYSARARAEEDTNLDRVLKLFPKLGERQGQIVRTMSGGEQQMVAIGRAMMSAPDILMLDEPSLGLSPLLCKELFQNLKQVKQLNIGVLLVEQNAKQSLAIADRGYLLENTHIIHEDTADRLANDPAVQAAYLGAGGQASAKPQKVAKVPAEKPAGERLGITPLTTGSSTTPRRSADEQIGLSIDDIVASATRTSAETPRKAAPAVTAAADRLARDRVGTVLKDIEAAAKAARSRKPRERRDSLTSNHPGTPRAGAENARPDQTQTASPPPVIEIYRRPRVEVYRRRPTGQFERD